MSTDCQVGLSRLPVAVQKLRGQFYMPSDRRSAANAAKERRLAVRSGASARAVVLINRSFDLEDAGRNFLNG